MIKTSVISAETKPSKGDRLLDAAAKRTAKTEAQRARRAAAKANGGAPRTAKAMKGRAVAAEAQAACERADAHIDMVAETDRGAVLAAIADAASPITSLDAVFADAAAQEEEAAPPTQPDSAPVPRWSREERAAKPTTGRILPDLSAPEFKPSGFCMNRAHALAEAQQAYGAGAQAGVDFSLEKLNGAWNWGPVQALSAEALHATEGKDVGLCDTRVAALACGRLRYGHEVPGETAPFSVTKTARGQWHWGPYKAPSAVEAAYAAKPAPGAAKAARAAKAAAKAAGKPARPAGAPAKRSSTGEASGPGAQVLALTSRPQGATVKEIQEAMGWKLPPGKHLFTNDKANGYCDRFGYTFSAEKDGKTTTYKTAKRA